jgi:hypothetical protein
MDLPASGLDDHWSWPAGCALVGVALVTFLPPDPGWLTMDLWPGAGLAAA